MSIWAIADLHLSFGVSDKEMSVFGQQWERHVSKIEKAWHAHISPDDLVLIPGDISWATHVEDARLDLEWIGSLPGTKILLKGNHDFWWGSLAKIKPILPPSCHLIQNNSALWNGVAIAGTRLWDIPQLNFSALIDFRPNAKNSNLTQEDQSLDSQKIFERELQRLETSLKAMDSQAHLRIAMTHYPPIGPQLEETAVSALLEKYRVNVCVFGHLHNLKAGVQPFGTHKGIRYLLTACDYLNFEPLQVI